MCGPVLCVRGQRPNLRFAVQAASGCVRILSDVNQSPCSPERGTQPHLVTNVDPEVQAPEEVHRLVGPTGDSSA
jgi:hypothetical protein